MSMALDQEGQARNPCSIISRELEEPLFGSVSQTQVWFLLEYPYPMGAKAFPESNLPASFKAAFSSFVSSIPGSRILLVKQRQALQENGVRLFICLSREIRPVLYELMADSYEDLLALDFPAILAEDPLYEENRRSEPLFTVCTNGRRDPCCARWGLPLSDKLTEVAPELVWQSSHVGGHRFAPNLICFPYGIYYGRVALEKAPALLEEYRQGLLNLDFYRGRSPYPAVAQAGEYFLRRQTGSLGLEDFLLKEIQQVDEQRWAVTFLTADGSTLHHLKISTRASGASAPESCRSEELKPVMLFHQDAYETAQYDLLKR